MMTEYKNIDLHMHTRISDGTDTPEELLQVVKKENIALFSVTDHDAIRAAKILPGVLAENDPDFLPGVEFSCRDEDGKYHILGYGYDAEGESINAIVRKGHGLRMKKVRARIDFLEAEFGFHFPEEALSWLFEQDNPGKPHIGNLMVKYGFAPTKEEAIKNYINKARTRSEYIRPEEAITAISESGGIPVLAHPFYGSGDELILGEEMDARLRKLTGYGLRGVEAFYSGFPKRLTEKMLSFADQYDLYVTAGSDYHGTNKLVRPGDTGDLDMERCPERLAKFLAEVRIVKPDRSSV